MIWEMFIRKPIDVRQPFWPFVAFLDGVVGKEAGQPLGNAFGIRLEHGMR
jgi:hypothetical protein